MTKPVATRVSRHRQVLRKAGLRPVQLWVPDTRASGFADECRRQSALLLDDAHDRATLHWIEDVSSAAGWK
ncbi:hypothetical protein B1A_04624 [mine drainage metagenome]|uniref:Antitoxin MazE n=1 Tax=mine drainage metagenome TaxID=410659 RepID=T1CVW6_9ZZZZ